MPSRSEQRLLCLRGVFLLLLTALYLSEKLLKLIYISLVSTKSADLPYCTCVS